MAYDPLPQAESGVLDELSVWQELEENPGSLSRQTSRRDFTLQQIIRSRSLVEDLMKDIRDGIEVYKGFRAIPSLGMLEQTWALAKWMIVPHMIAMLMIAIIGLVACLSAVVTSQNGLTACCVEMFGVLIDSQLITRFLAQATTGFVALLSYMLANLDIRKEELCMWDLEMMV
ncbi:Ankyrin-2 [Durusdinium trenchii]|uniref:Ankyrin-2 n=1 Tax=Durusdinium trenchii TaxID=1381693 RepID=A0ABP0NFL9_9DINO